MLGDTHRFVNARTTAAHDCYTSVVFAFSHGRETRPPLHTVVKHPSLCNDGLESHVRCVAKDQLHWGDPTGSGGAYPPRSNWPLRQSRHKLAIAPHQGKFAV